MYDMFWNFASLQHYFIYIGGEEKLQRNIHQTGGPFAFQYYSVKMCKFNILVFADYL